MIKCLKRTQDFGPLLHENFYLGKYFFIMNCLMCKSQINITMKNITLVFNGTYVLENLNLCITYAKYGLA